MRHPSGRRPGSATSYSATRSGKIGTNAWLSPEVHSELRRIADERGETMAALNTAAIEEFVERARAEQDHTA
jgi:hypothetical protein